MQILLKPYAVIPENVRGRLFDEPESSTRTSIQRDRDRIIHSHAFRRLEYKTQVFVNHEGDYYRTRLTHSLEVAQISRSLCRNLGLNEDLGEALALAHDLGHPPFGHAGEDGLHEAMKDFGGFDHNAQTIRILTKLEQRYAAFDGLNLTWETLEGIAKHNGPVKNPPRAIIEYNEVHDLELDTYPSLEAQVAALSDDIAYHNHDIDDGLRAKVFSIDELMTVELAANVINEVRATYKDISISRLIHETNRRLINMMVADLIRQTNKNIKDNRIETVDDARKVGKATVNFSAEMQEHNRCLKNFLMQNMYRNYRVNRMSSKARRTVIELFKIFLAEPSCLPDEWRRETAEPNSLKTAHIVCDFIAGMTDRFAIDEHKKMFDVALRS